MSSRIVELHPGETSKIVTITLDGVADYTGYTGEVIVRVDSDEPSLISRVFAADPVKGLEFFLTAAETETLPVGIYEYVYVVDKTVLTVVEYHREIIVTLVITEEAIVTSYTVQEIIDIAKYGELRQLSMKDDAEAMMSYISLGVNEIYKRFPINTQEQMVDLVTNTTTYRLAPDCMYVLAAYDEDGVELSINDETDEFSILTPSFNTIQVPTPETGLSISIIYAASHPKITSVNDGVNLPPQFLEALLHYIGYRAHGSMDGLINTENNTHYMRFEASCSKIKTLGLITHDNNASTKFEDKGFV